MMGIRILQGRGGKRHRPTGRKKEGDGMARGGRSIRATEAFSERKEGLASGGTRRPLERKEGSGEYAN